MAVDDHAFAADHHFAHQVAVAAEDPAVGDVFAGGAGEAGRGGVEQDVVVDVVERGRLRAPRGTPRSSVSPTPVEPPPPALLRWWVPSRWRSEERPVG